MKFSIKSTNFKLTPEVSRHIAERMEKIDKFTDQSDESVQAWVEIGRTTKRHKKGDIYRAEIQVRLAGKSSRVEAVNKNILRAFNEAAKDLQRELRRHKNRKRVIRRKRGRTLKKVFGFSWLRRQKQ